MWRFFFNPMGVYTFCAENHWATKAAFNIVQREIIDEGTKLVYHPSVGPDELAKADARFKQLDLRKYAVDTAMRFLAYGNVYTLPETNGLGQYGFRLKNLAADRDRKSGE